MERIRDLLRQYRDGDLEEDEILQRIVRQPFEELLLGRFDTFREARTGIPEAILAENKDPIAVADIFRRYIERDEQLIATRVGRPILEELAGELPSLFHDETARILATQPPSVDAERSSVLVISAGSLDRPVAEECATTSRLLGNPTELLLDVGVAGLNRLASSLSRLDEAGIVIVVAGMDGALPSVVGGLAIQPVISVPTSVGYGASFQGVSALLAMLNSCVPGTAVMNIDNGFGAAVLATKINLLAARGSGSRSDTHPDPG